jgi:hypothetical protein
MSTVVWVKGICNGKALEVLKSIPALPNTEMEILFQESGPISEEQERRFVQELFEKGLISEISPQQIDSIEYEPIHVKGEAISTTIIRERR